MVCDDNTYEAAGKEVERLLGGIPSDQTGSRKPAC